MNYRMIVYMLSLMAVFEAVVLVIPFLLGVFYHEDTLLAFGITIAALFAAGVPFIIKKPADSSLRIREGFIIVALSWVLISLFGALPFCISGKASFIDSLFETISGFTTTGASIFADVESLPKSLLFWRSFTHWLGGMGVLVFVIAVLPKAETKIIHLFRAESPGPQKGKLVSKIRFTARILYGIYIALTLIEIILLLSGGMSLFDSLIHAFGTAGTGGFSNKNLSVAAYDSVYIQIVITVFMIIFGINFNVFYLVLIGKARQAVKSEELRVYLLIIGVAITLVTGSLLFNNVYANFGDSLRISSFQVASIISTTGFGIADYTQWPAFTQLVILFLMFFGGCAGSTGGGLKISRIIILFKTAMGNIRKTISPKTVVNIKMDGKPLDDTITRGVQSYFAIFALLLVGSTLLVAVSNRMSGTAGSMVTYVSSVITCLNNVGPGFGVIGPVGNYSAFSMFSKIILSFDMLAGRLEILPILLLFYPKTWRGR